MHEIPKILSEKEFAKRLQLANRYIHRHSLRDCLI